MSEIACPICGNSQVIKYGKHNNGQQRYLCKPCNRQIVSNYTPKPYRFLHHGNGVVTTKFNDPLRQHAHDIGLNRVTINSRKRRNWGEKSACVVPSERG